MQRFSSSRVVLAALAVFVLVPIARAHEPVVENPFGDRRDVRVRLDLRPGATHQRPLVDPPYPLTPRFEELDAFLGLEPGPAEDHSHELPRGLAQIGGMIVPEAMLHGADMVPTLELVQSGEIRPQADNATVEDICAFPDEVPAGFYDRVPRPGEERPRFHTIFLNYNGGEMKGGAENSAENQSSIARTGHVYPVYAGGEMRAIAAAQAVQADFDRYAVRVVYRERPPKVLPYTMVMMGGSYTDTTSGPAGGVAPLDCEDVGLRNVAYMFQAQSSPTTQANIASQEIGHTIGLGHTRARDSVMALSYAPTNDGDLGFSNECAPILTVSDQGASCIGINRCHCGVPDRQHDVNTIFAGFAPAGVDMVEPTIEVVTPADGDVFEAGESVRVELAPWDDVGGYGWKLIVRNDDTREVIVDQVDYSRQLTFDLQFPPGKYTIRGEVMDHADHVGTDEIHIEVVGSLPEPNDSGAGTDSGEDGEVGGSDGEDEAGSADESGSDGGTDPGTNRNTDEGCACDTRAVDEPALAVLLLAGLGVFRRRRVRARP